MSPHVPRTEVDEQQISQAGVDRPKRFAVIGAGLAGLAAARTLQDHGQDVIVYDKSRGVGGRTSIRRNESFAFDHGAQYFTARDARFRRYVDAWAAAGVVAEWRGRIAAIGGGTPRFRDSTTRYVGVPGMNSMAKHLAAELDVIVGRRVSKLARRESTWHLSAETGADLGKFDAVVIALPSTQAAALLSTAGVEDSRIESCQLAPCWAVLLGFGHSIDVSFDGAFVGESALSWIARNNSKPGRPSGESWVLHASPDWSAEHIDRDRQEVIDALTEEFERVAACAALRPIHRDAHRWRYALPPEPLGEGCLWNEKERWAVCGDWCQGARVEGAFLSGIAAAERLLGIAPSVAANARDEGTD